MFIRTRAGRRTAFDYDPEVWVMNADGTGQRFLVDGGFRGSGGAGPVAKWSPDGTAVLFTRLNRLEVFSINLDSGGEEAVWQAPGWATGIHGVEWSPDGLQMLVTVEDNTRFFTYADWIMPRVQIFLVDLGSGAAVNLADGAFRGDDMFDHSNFSPSWRR